MNTFSKSELTEKIIAKAKSLGATIAGVASVESLKGSPSHQIFPIIGTNLENNFNFVKEGEKIDKVAWPTDALSAIVIGVEHNEEEPALDWWDGKGTPGNRILIKINKELSEWIENSLSIKTYKLSYFVGKGGIFLKDAAVMAGLGCIGKNNLLITPEYGPRIRFRALLLDCETEATGPIEFNPCGKCKQPCRKSCPINAFQKCVYSADEIGLSILPGINGTYDRVTCSIKMKKDIDDAAMGASSVDDEQNDVREAINEFEETDKVPSKNDNKSISCVKYCRKCELACPLGM